MTRTIGFALVVFLVSGATPVADQGNGHKKGKSPHASDAAEVGAHVAFGNDDVVMLREYYAPRYRELPPGLQKKVARGGELPPGWQKKLEPFPVALDRRLPPLPAGYGRGVVDGHAVIYNAHTNVIVDVAVLF